jgi:hypothetical protein
MQVACCGALWCLVPPYSSFIVVGALLIQASLTIPRTHESTMSSTLPRVSTLARQASVRTCQRPHVAGPPARWASQTSRPASNLRRRNARLTTTADGGECMTPYGLKRVDYSQIPPPWRLPPAPPPSTNPIRRYFPAFMLTACTSLFVWIYFNQDETVYDYWRAVEMGDVPVDDYDDDDDDDDDDEALDLTNVDEWEEKGQPETKR